VESDLQLQVAQRLRAGRRAEPSGPRRQTIRTANLPQIEGLLRRAVTLDSKFAKACLELGILLSEQQRYVEAIPQLRRATRLEPDLAQAHYRLAQAYQRTGQKTLAAKEFEIFERLSG
jgi:tetratricopeptide (TPR) repeat protein